MEWNRLPRDKASAILSALAGQENAAVFAEATTEVVWQELPFYDGFKLYQLTNYATMPSFQLHYISNGTVFFPIDGTANPIFSANEAAKINLDETNAISYLDFFFKNISAPDGQIFLLKSQNDMGFMDNLSLDQQQKLLTTFQPIVLNSDIIPHNFHVKCTLYYDGCLISSTVQITAEGKVFIHEQNMLMQGVYMPLSHASQQWSAPA